ncbi:hypothetical protein RYX36_022745 [Vicia faba]
MSHFRIADAEENLGESEVREAHLAKSLFFIRIGDKEKALEHLKITETKTVAVGQKMDLVFYTLQLGFFDMDFDLISKSIDKAKRNFEKAATLFLDSISTFTTYELFPYDTFIFYTVLTSIITLDRVSLKQKRHARSEKLHREGRLKVMLNSDGEIENQEDSDKETEDTEVGSSTV